MGSKINRGLVGLRPHPLPSACPGGCRLSRRRPPGAVRCRSPDPSPCWSGTPPIDQQWVKHQCAIAAGVVDEADFRRDHGKMFTCEHRHIHSEGLNEHAPIAIFPVALVIDGGAGADRPRLVCCRVDDRERQHERPGRAGPQPHCSDRAVLGGGLMAHILLRDRHDPTAHIARFVGLASFGGGRLMVELGTEFRRGCSRSREEGQTGDAYECVFPHMHSPMVIGAKHSLPCHSTGLW